MDFIENKRARNLNSEDLTKRKLPTTKIIIPLLITSLFSLSPISFTDSVFCTPAAAAAANPSAGRAGEKEKRVERLRRFLQRTTDDLNDTQKLASEDIDDLEKQVDAIALLESSQREADFQGLLDWYNGYLDWLREQNAGFEADLARLSAARLQESQQMGERFAEIVNAQKDMEKDMGERVARFSAEEKRLAGILERRRLLQAEFNDLQERLAHIERKGADQNKPLSEKEKATAERLRVDVTVVQTEFLSLPQVDEDLLKHYAVMTERARWASEWLAMKIDEYDTLRDVAVLVPGDALSLATDIQAAYDRTKRMYERQVNRLNRKLDELDRKRSRVSPAGTLREMDRSRELGDFYDRLRTRYNERINRLKIQIGAYEAESADILSFRP